MRGKWLLLAASAIVLGCAAGALSLLRRGSAPKQTGAITAAVASSELSLPGTIQAQHAVAVGATVAGTIDAILVDVGQDVYEGQPLARISNQGLESAREEAVRTAQNAQEKGNSIESRIIAARLEASRSRADANRSRAQFERAEKAYLRQQMLNREGATPRLVYEKSEREFATARTEFESLDELARQADNRVTDLIRELDAAKRAMAERNAELETATAQSAGAEIRSPVSGIVVARNGDAGKPIGPEEAKDLLQIAVDLSRLAVIVQPDAAARKRIRPSQDALIYIADFPGAIPASVKRIDASGITLEFISPSAVIRPGMTAQVRLKLE
jgi:HlyD family secretion protein